MWSAGSIGTGRVRALNYGTVKAFVGQRAKAVFQRPFVVVPVVSSEVQASGGKELSPRSGCNVPLLFI